MDGMGQEYKVRPAPKGWMVCAVYLVLRFLVLLTLAAQIVRGNWQNAALCVLTLLLYLLPSALERQLRVTLPDALEVVICLFLFASAILGEVHAFYAVFPNWDTVLHGVNGFLCAAIGFALSDLFSREARFSLRLSPGFAAVCALCFSMTVAVLWEFFEFGMDALLHLDMQKDTVLSSLSSVALDPDHGLDPVTIGDIRDVILVLEDGAQVPLGLGGYLDPGGADTMADLWVNFLGAAVFSVLGWCYAKGRGHLAGRFIPRPLRLEKFGPSGRIDDAEVGYTAPVRNIGPLFAAPKEEMTMTTDRTNPSIRCSVNSCAYHKDSHCTLNEIQVGCCQNNVGQCKETECASFQLGDHGTSCGCT